MRYNSLRSQLNWHSRQQTHIFKKLNRNEDRDRDRDSEKQEDLLKGNELIWLEKMMKELHQYKEETQEQDKTKKGKDPEQAEVIKEKSGRDGRGNVDRHQKIVVNLDEPGKSAKKIKFQIVINPDKPHSAKKIVNSEPKAKPKSVKKPVAKTTPKKSLGEKMSAGRESSASKEANSSKEIKVSCPSNTKVIDVQSMKTDPYTFSQANLQVLDELWKKEEKGSEPEPKLSSKKSVGKIIRNSDKLNKTCIEMPAKEIKPQLNISLNTINNSVQNTSYKQYKQSAGKQSASIHSFYSKELSSELKEQPSIVLSQQPYKEIKQQQSKIPQNNQKFKYQKIYIKLQTQKLSEYLTEKSQAKEENCSQKIKTNEYEKYCETKRNERPNPTLEQSLKKSLTNQKKEHETLTQKYKEEPAPRAKSQQRKFNKFAQIVRPAKLSDYEVARIKPAVKSIDQSIVFSTQTKEKQPENKIQIKLKRKYDYKDEQLPSKAQKLFTLHSVASDYSSNQEFREAKPPKVVTEEPSRPSLSTELQEETSLPTISQPSSITIPDSHIQSQQSLSESHFKESVVIKDFDPSKTDYTEQLTLLFNFLDEGRRGLLTDTNCHSDLLTQQLKLLFSVILNQIRTKKRFYNLQKFIEESKEILQIKNEVYNSNNRSVQVKNMVYQILKENIDILKKKLPLMFVKFSYTQSCFQTSNEQSKKNSVTEGQSFVIDKVHFDHTAPKKEIEDCIFSESFKDRSNDFVRLEVPDKNVINEIRLVQKGRRDKQNIEKYEVSYRKSTRKLEDTKTDLDMMQPQIYLEKKYGFGKGQAQECINTQKLSSMFLKTRGYLQNLDSYLKMR